MESLTIIGKRWFRKGPGTTYHSSTVIVDGREVYTCPYAYGYGRQYEETAARWLEEQNYIQREERYESLFRYCERNSIVFLSLVSDVDRKKDL